MDIKEINKLMFGEDFDELVARHIMGWDESAIENVNIPLPEYSKERKEAIAVIEAITFMSDEIVNKFDMHLEKYMDEMTKRHVKRRPSSFLLYLAPDIICQAALKAVLI